jgi:hypothetical protein
MVPRSNPPHSSEPAADAGLAPDRRFIEVSRVRAYGRIVDVLREIGPAKVHAAEIELVRGAADAQLFAADLDDGEARAALADTHTLARDLVTSQRWTSERAARLLHDIRACGPAVTSGLREAA